MPTGSGATQPEGGLTPASSRGGVRDGARAGGIGAPRRSDAADSGSDLPDARVGVRRVVARGPARQRAAAHRGLAHAGHRVRRVRDAEPRDVVCQRRGPARTRLGGGASGVHSRRAEGRELSARAGGGARASARRVWLPRRARARSARRHGVLQPGHPRARRRAADDARHDRPADRPVHRAAPGGRRSRSLLRAVARHAVHRGVRRLLPADQPRVAAHARLHGRGALRQAVPRLRPSDRSREDAGRSGEDRRRGERAAVRKPVPLPRRDLPAGSPGRPSRTRTSS